MPFEPKADPDLAGQFMFRGISQAGQAFAKGVDTAFEAFATKSKERKEYLGMADGMARAGEISDVERAAMNNWDTDHIKGWVDGKKVAATLANLRQQGAEAQARAGLYQQQAESGREEMTNSALQPEFMSAMERYLSPTGGYEAAVQSPEGRAAMIAGTVSSQPLSPLSAISRAASETKYKVRPNQLDDILRAANASRTVQVPEGFTPSKMVAGGVTYEAPPTPITAPPGFNPTQIVIGEDGKPRVTLEPAAAPVAIPSGMQPRSVTVDAKGKPTVTYAEPDAAKKLAANYPWLLDDDMEKFKAGLREIQDPAERNAVIATRNHYETALGRPTVEERMLFEFMHGKSEQSPGGSGTTKKEPQTPTKPTPGPVVRMLEAVARDSLPTAENIGILKSWLRPTNSTAAPTPATPKAKPESALKVPAGRVRVVSPDGRIGNIPAAQLDEALKAGYKQLD